MMMMMIVIIIIIIIIMIIITIFWGGVTVLVPNCQICPENSHLCCENLCVQWSTIYLYIFWSTLAGLLI